MNIQDWPSKHGYINLRDIGLCADPGRDCWKTFEGRTYIILPKL